jgi:anti-anti-sigma factor
MKPTPEPGLELMRLPGESGPILHCVGELCEATVERLRREITELHPLGHRVVTLDLSECHFLDVEGIMTILQSFKQLWQEGRRLVLVAGTGPVARWLSVTGIDRVVPTFPSQHVAAVALRGGGPPEAAPADWAEARAQTLARWRAIQETLDQAPPEELMRQLTTMVALCERSQELFEESPEGARVRCQFCPLFHALGGRPADIGCRSVLDPILAAVRAENKGLARDQVARMIHTLETMPLPEGEIPPTPGLAAAGYREETDTGHTPVPPVPGVTC